MVLFAHHNLIKDPPFSHLDLISCRNLLIYLNRVAAGAADRDVPLRAAAAGATCSSARRRRPTAPAICSCASTGDRTSTRAGRSTSRRRVVAARRTPDRRLPHGDTRPVPSRRVRRSGSSPADLHQRLLEQYAPPSVIVTEEHKSCTCRSGPAASCQVRGGEPSRDLLAAGARRAASRSAHRALPGGARRTSGRGSRGHRRHRRRSRGSSIMAVRPVLREGDPARGYFLVTVRRTRRDAASRPREPLTTLTSPIEPVTRQLEDELTRRQDAAARHRRAVRDARSRRPKASNEELQAMNEELRSAAEELETSKEELQSVNEELTTVNQELKIKIEELGLTNNDFQNFINATDIGAIFLDRMLRVKFSTPACPRSVQPARRPTSAGRSRTSPASCATIPAARRRPRRARASCARRARGADEDGRWHLMRMLPYRTSDNRIDGVVITFHDITERRDRGDAGPPERGAAARC